MNFGAYHVSVTNTAFVIESVMAIGAVDFVNILFYIVPSAWRTVLGHYCRMDGAGSLNISRVLG